MRKFILAIGALLVTSSACYAAFAIFQTYIPPAVSQITCNLTTGVASSASPCVSPAATCNGDVVTATRTTTTTSGTKNITVTANTFNNPGDVGKVLYVPGANFITGRQYSVITAVGAFSGTQTVTVTDNAGASLAGASTILTYGTDDAPAFKAFNTWARTNQGSANQVVLTVPTGSNCWFGSVQSYSPTIPANIGNAIQGGIHNLIVEGAGATLNNEPTGAGWWLGGVGLCERGLTDAAGCSARIQTASSGSSTVTLTAASLSAGYISRFSVNGWLMVGGLNIQATTSPGSGVPPNLNYFEWRQITNINAGTGVITLDRALTNSYLDTWPGYNSGNSGNPDPGGPATIWAVPDTWQWTAEYRGLTFSSGAQTYSPLRNVTYRNVTFTDQGAIPTQNENWSLYSGDYTGLTMEVDKLIGTMTIDGITISQLKFQSSSSDLFVGRNLNVTNSLTGGPKSSQISDSTIATWAPGSYAYGASKSNTCTRCAVASFTYLGGITQGGIADYSMSGGVISFLNSSVTGSGPDSRIFVPPHGNVYYKIGGGTGDSVGLFNAQAATQDATNTYIQTNEAGGFPTPPIGLFGFRVHSSPQFTCDACTGTISLTSMNIQNGATPLAPLGSYVSANYAPASAAGDLGILPSVGKIVSFTVNVTQAYNGTGSAVLNAAARFNNLLTIKQSDWSNFTFGPIINLKQAGVRAITPSGVTCDTGGGPVAGGCLGDTIGTLMPEAVWIKGEVNPWMSSTLAAGNQPQFTITIQTDQGVVP